MSLAVNMWYISVLVRLANIPECTLLGNKYYMVKHSLSCLVIITCHAEGFI